MIGVIGGISIIVAILGLILWRRRKKRRAERYTPEGMNKMIYKYNSGSSGKHTPLLTLPFD